MVCKTAFFLLLLLHLLQKATGIIELSRNIYPNVSLKIEFMKKIFFAALMSAIFAVGAMAQYRPSIIVSAGYQGANISGVKDSKIASGARAGVALDFGVYNNGAMELSVQPGLNFSMKGAAYKEGDFKAQNSLYYIDLPILANLRFDAGNGLNAFVNAGPYLAYGLGGHRKVGDKKESTNPFKKTKLGNTELSVYRPFDWGLQVGAGLEYSRVMLGVGSQIGLYDITTNYDLPVVGKAGDVNKNTSFFVTLGYRF